MSRKEGTVVRVSKEVWDEIKKRKDLGVTSDDVLRNALKLPPRVEAREA